MIGGFDFYRIKKMALKPSKILLALASRGLINMSDQTYLCQRYFEIFHKKLDLSNPQTFNEKLQWLKLYDHKSIYTTMVDKYAVKEYVSNLIGNQYIIPTYGVWKSFDDIDFSGLPNQFVLKCSHDSGGIVICTNKDKLDMGQARKKINRSLKRNYYLTCREWPYKDVKPCVIAEKYMEEQGKGMKDYKFMCFGGKVKCSFVCSGRFEAEGMKVTFFDLDWNVMLFERHYPKSRENIAKPKNYELMISLAERLAADIPFVRVDFYEINGCVYFGELTFFPGSGFEEFTPESADYEIGSWIDLPL